MSFRWSLNEETEISQTDFSRIVFIALLGVLIAFPFSVYIFVYAVITPRWEIPEGQQWTLIIKDTRPPGWWQMWVGPIWAVILFMMMGTTKFAMEVYVHWMERVVAFSVVLRGIVRAASCRIWMRKPSEPNSGGSNVLESQVYIA
jgi:hypothetical protein